MCKNVIQYNTLPLKPSFNSTLENESFNEVILAKVEWRRLQHFLKKYYGGTGGRKVAEVSLYSYRQCYHYYFILIPLF